ncbi:hypothetical protein KP509_30G074400 [Ceratopteris richardii]|uniref:Uncharacterized protein n=1 Tax=Ceratopteris richardii TaxID=49495 RepID=A0A8T2R3Z3_CERRI|nr:hypothetical protein KP509_30G074400 [Ceratopteris richardii]
MKGRSREAKPTSNGQDSLRDEPLSWKSGQLLEFEVFLGSKTKFLRRIKDETPTFHDPARELFEAELERIQKMQEEERERCTEECRRAVEFARIEECKGLVREEEPLFLKSEDNPRETATRAQRGQEEAAERINEVHRTRQQENHAVIIKEDRSKGAAIKKLVEIEECITLIESGQIASSDSYAISQDDNKRVYSLTKFDNDCVLDTTKQPLQNLDQKAYVSSSQFIPLKCSTWQPYDLNVGEALTWERKRLVELNKGDVGVAKQETQSTMYNYRNGDNPSCESHVKGFFVENSGMDSISSFSVEGSQVSLTEHGEDSPYGKEDSRFSNDDRNLPTELNVGYTGFESEENSGIWLNRSNLCKIQALRQMNSPILFPHDDEFVDDHSSSGCPNWSLAKESIIPSRMIGRPNLQKEISISIWAAPCAGDQNSSNNHHREDSISSGQEVIWERNREKCHIAGIDTPQAVPLTSIEISEPINDATSVFDETIGELKSAFEHALSTSIEMIDPTSNVTSMFDETARALTNALEFHKYEASQSDDVENDELSMLGTAEDTGEEICYEGRQIEGAIWHELFDESSMLGTLEDTGEEICYRGRQIEETIGHELFDLDSNKSKNTEGIITVSLSGIEETQLEEPILEHSIIQGENCGMEDEDGVVEDKLDGLVMDSVRNADSCLGHLGDQAQTSPYLQRFQQPFSFMAVPLPRSITVDGVKQHPPMFSPICNHQTPHELSYQSQTGVFRSAHSMSNTCHLGHTLSVQEQTQIHPATRQHQQLPVFQFGQLWQLDQPMHHAWSTIL